MSIEEILADRLQDVEDAQAELAGNIDEEVSAGGPVQVTAFSPSPKLAVEMAQIGTENPTAAYHYLSAELEDLLDWQELIGS